MGTAEEQSPSGSQDYAFGADKNILHSSSELAGTSDAAGSAEILQAGSQCTSSTSLAHSEALEQQEPVTIEQNAAAEGYIARRSLDGAADAPYRSHSGVVSRTSSRGSMSAMYRSAALCPTFLEVAP